MLPLNNNKDSRDTNTLCQLWDQLEVHDGILWRCYSQPHLVQPYLQLVIPSVLRDKILRELHEGHVSGHLGMQKFLSLVKERFYWPGHASDVATWCKTCAVCASRKSTIPQPRAPMQSVPSSYPLELVAVDILGPLPVSHNGNKCFSCHRLFYPLG